MKNCGDFCVFLLAFVNELAMADEKEEDKNNDGDFCSSISRLHERLGEL